MSVPAVTRDGTPASFIAAGEAATGDCVYVANGCYVTLFGDAQIDEIYFVSDSADALTVEGCFSGSATLAYGSGVSLTEGTVLGVIAPADDLSEARLSIGNVDCKKLSVGDGQLTVLDDHGYQATVTAPTCIQTGYTTYTCAVCGDQYIADETPVTDHSYQSTMVEATCTTDGSIVIICTVCGNTKTAVIPATGHRYEDGICGTCGAEDPDYITIPTLTLKAPALEFKDMVKVIAFFTAENTKDVVEMGMVTYGSDVSEASVETADHVIPGAILEESSGRYFASSQGINAKYLGDTVYLACYAKLSDGSYVYTRVAPCGAVQYATSQLKNSTDVKLKQLVVAMLNYGAAAQNYFGYNTDVPANASLTAEADGQYRGDITDIAAKNLAQAVYVAAVYSDGTTTWTSGVLGYSIGAYCASQATKGGTIADLAMATAVYGYHAKQYFG